MILVSSTAAGLVLLVIAFTLLFGRLLSRREDSQSLAGWLESFSLDDYRPMERLLNANDYRFLASQPGYEPAIGRRLRAERKRIFRAYLRQMANDFRRLVRIARVMMVYSEQDRPDLARAIATAQVRFYWNLILAQVSLILPVPSGSAQVGRLINAITGVADRMPATAVAKLAEN